MKSEVQFLLCDMFLSNRPDIPAKQWDVPAASVFWHFTSRFPRRQCQGIYLQDSLADQQWHHPNSFWHPEGPNKVRIYASTTCNLIAIWAIYLFFWYLIFWKKKMKWIDKHTDSCFYIFTFSTYTVKPAKALLKGQQQIFVVKITPNDVKHYKHDLTFRLNDDEKYNKVRCPPIILDIEWPMYI